MDQLVSGSSANLKTCPIQLAPGLYLYKQPKGDGGGSPFWYARVRMRIGSKTVFTRSTRTADLPTAKRNAEDFYAELLILRRYGEGALSVEARSVTKPLKRFDIVAEEWLVRLHDAAGSDSRRVRAYEDARKLVYAPNGLIAFFKRTDVTAVDLPMIESYLVFAQQKSRNGFLAQSTKRNHLGVLKAILKSAFDRRMIPAIPSMPRVRVKDNPRSWFRPEEYRLLWRIATKLSQYEANLGNAAKAAQWLELRDFIIFQVNTFLRPSEWRELRQKHVTICGTGDAEYLRIAVPNGKTGQRTVISMPAAVLVFRRILKREGVDCERYLFKSRYRNRQTAYDLMRLAFDALLGETGLGPDEHGKKRTIYSLRHTALMLRLLKGDNVDHILLARNAGTSVDQLERFYVSHLQAEMMIDNLHSFKTVPREGGAATKAPRPRRIATIDVESGLAETGEIMAHVIQVEAPLRRPQ